MSKYSVILLKELIETKGEETAQSILSTFLCPKNPDIEFFLKNKAIGFELQRISSTHLVFNKNASKPILLGYFTLGYISKQMYDCSNYECIWKVKKAYIALWY